MPLHQDRELENLSKQKYVTAYGVALIHAGLGQKDLAFQWFNKAFDERSHWLVWLRIDPRWDALRSDPRFADLIKRMHFPRLELRNRNPNLIWRREVFL